MRRVFHSKAAYRSTGSSGFLVRELQVVLSTGMGSLGLRSEAPSKHQKLILCDFFVCVCLKTVFQFLSFMIIYPLCLDSLHPVAFHLCELIVFPSAFWLS